MDLADTRDARLIQRMAHTYSQGYRRTYDQYSAHVEACCYCGPGTPRQTRQTPTLAGNHQSTARTLGACICDLRDALWLEFN